MGDAGSSSKDKVAASQGGGWVRRGAESATQATSERRQTGLAATIEPIFREALRLQSAGQLEEAKQLYLRVLALDVKHAWSLFGLGQIAFQRGNCEVAANMIRRAIASNEREPVYHAGLGGILQFQGKLDEAAAEFQLSLAQAPKDAAIRANLAAVYFLLGRAEEAEVEYGRSLALAPDSAQVRNDLATALRSLGKLKEAAAECRAALGLNPDFAEAHDNLAQTFRELERFEEAAAEYERAIVLAPNCARFQANLGNLNLARGRNREARERYELALSVDPDFKTARWNRSLLDLLEGNYEQGWRDYELRAELNYRPPRRFPQKLWRGEPLAGARILLHSEQGLGDTLQFLRYVPLVQAAGGEVLLDVPERVRRLAESLPGLAALTVDGDSLQDFESHCPLMSLPLAFGTALGSIPSRTPYLRVPEESKRSAASISWPRGGLRVGLIWCSGPANRFRSIPLGLLEPLWDAKNVHFFSLQLGEAAAELANCHAPVADLQDHMPDLADTGALMQQLDLIITVDTCTAHLAGALGLAAWVLLPFAPDWRWLLDREDSPWYPTLRLFRQPRPADWRPVLDRVRRELCLLNGGEEQSPLVGAKRVD